MSFDVRVPGDRTDARDVLAPAIAELHAIDRIFSPYRPDSLVCAIRRGDLFTPLPSVVLEVLEGCRTARRLTDGRFDPWSLPSGFDPSGYVKGWAADRVAQILVAEGATRVCVNAGGDVAVRGGSADERPWRVGIRDPLDVTRILTTVSITDGAVATSGSYERGLHVLEPTTGRPADGLSATVVGPDGGLADAFATAMLVARRTGARWFESLPDWSALVVDADGAWTVGPHFERDDPVTAGPAGPTRETSS